MAYSKEDIFSQVDIQKLCEQHSIGRHDLIHIATKVAKEEDIRPHDALKKLVEVQDLEQYFKELKERSLKAEFNSKF
tara:strand:- start:488 stop:718 length:231 start_codon:yes stop_codon:yes gene_type:complete